MAAWSLPGCPGLMVQFVLLPAPAPIPWFVAIASRSGSPCNLPWTETWASWALLRAHVAISSTLKRPPTPIPPPRPPPLALQWKVVGTLAKRGHTHDGGGSEYGRHLTGYQWRNRESILVLLLDCPNCVPIFFGPPFPPANTNMPQLPEKENRQRRFGFAMPANFCPADPGSLAGAK